MIFYVKIKIFLEEHSKLVLFFGILFYSIFFSWLTLKKLGYFGYNSFDVAIFNQIFFNTLHGRWMEMTVNLNIYLADHFAPFIFFYLPFYALKPGPEALLVLQNIVIASASWPLYLIARKISNSNSLALTVGFLWLLNPFVQRANFYEFHQEVIIAFLFFTIFYFYLKKNLKYFLLFFFLALLVREDMAFFLVGFTLLALIERRKWQWSILPIILSALYFFTAIKIIAYFSISEQYKFFKLYGWLGGHDAFSVLWSFVSHPWLVIKHIFVWKNIANTFLILWPLLFLPFYQGKYLLLSLVGYLLVLLHANGLSHFSINTHYILFILPGIFIAFAYALHKLWFYKHKKYLLLLLFFTTIYLSVIFGPVRSFFIFDFDQQKISDQKKIISQISQEASIVASQSFLSQLSSREKVYPIKYAFFGYSEFNLEKFQLPDLEYILIDFEDFIVGLVEKTARKFPDNHKGTMNDNWRSIIFKYDLVEVRNDIFLFKAKEEKQENLFMAEVIDFDGEEENGLIVGHEFFEDKKVLELLINTDFFAENYLIRFYQQDYYYDLPLAYALFSVKTLEKNKTLKVHYYLAPGVDSFQIFSWQGENKLGSINEAAINLRLTEETEKISF
jgi:uncharacterized membrane protein